MGKTCVLAKALLRALAGMAGLGVDLGREKCIYTNEFHV
jgi:hypothetical protein